MQPKQKTDTDDKGICDMYKCIIIIIIITYHIALTLIVLCLIVVEAKVTCINALYLHTVCDSVVAPPTAHLFITPLPQCILSSLFAVFVNVFATVSVQ